MFTVDTAITDLNIREKNLYKVLFSMNIHQVATPELSAEDARSYVFFFREESGKIGAYIALYFIHSGRKLYYIHSENPFPESMLSAVEDEARNFAEDMGAMLDELNVTAMSPEDRNTWIEEQDIFSTKKAAGDFAETQTAAPAPPHGESVEQKETAPPVPSAPAESGALPSPGSPESVPPVSESPVQTSVSPVDGRLPVQPPVSPVDSPLTVEPRVPPVQPPLPVQSPSVRQSMDNLVEEPVKGDAVNRATRQAKKDIRTANGTVGREREALARLLASF